MAATITVTNIIDRVEEDFSDQFGTSGSTSVLIDYIDRIHASILRKRPWDWLLSTPQRFITERGQTLYWVGATGSQAAGEVDTGLNLTDVRRVLPDSVFNRTSHRPLWQGVETPLARNWQREDASYSEAPPVQFRNDEASRDIIEISPAPDTGSSYEMVPPGPHSTTSTSGALSARTYFIRTTFVDLEGNEGSASTTARQFIEVNKVITVKAPQPTVSPGAAGISYLRWNIYASTTEGSETRQASNTATSADFTEPDTGLTTNGASVPASSELDPLRGYLIEFRYAKVHKKLTTGNDILLIPDDYRDVVVAGVNSLAAAYRKKFDLAAYWDNQYRQGLIEMTRNQNPFPGGRRFIKPDGQRVGSRVVRPW